MPTYDYRCKKCGEVFETFQSITEDPLKTHPGCGGRVNRVFAPVGIVFKGSGFHKTDSRRSSGARRGSSNGEGSGDGAKTGDAKTGDAKTGDTKTSSSSEGAAAGSGSAA